ncbi:DUF5067 domain-containing protein [Bifidobacterium commune]|uniref:DUF5067 domain-containing protein n=1 Tax=Bifidobacterium commune TaxID=1505727 RepID=A0A1C4H0C6_9BIFI|nr:DUF5067 domain-containing protein [Bifidobacterium commune]SCC78339.1 protein of unknown function [Bifidobacterium commune]
MPDSPQPYEGQPQYEGKGANAAYGNPRSSSSRSDIDSLGTPVPTPTNGGQPTSNYRGRGGDKPERLSAGGVTALVLGIIGTVLSFIPIVNNLAAILGVIGLVFGIVGFVGVRKGKKRGKGITIAGIVLSVIAIVITLVMQSATGKALDSASKGDSSSSSQSQSVGKQNAGQSKPDSKPSTDKQDTEGDLGSAHVKIESAVRSGNDYNNAKTVLVTYQWTNNSDKNQAFGTLLSAKAFQNGQELDMAIYTQAPQGYDSQSYLAQLQPGAQGNVTVGYVLKDDSPVTVEVDDLFSAKGKAKVTHIYDL